MSLNIQSKHSISHTLIEVDSPKRTTRRQYVYFIKVRSNSTPYVGNQKQCLNCDLYLYLNCFILVIKNVN